jgi:predicted TIM-barrel fold metal-dependent hydrolase
MSQTATLERPTGVADTRYRIIDCDIHPAVKSIDDVRKFLPQRWADYHKTYGDQVRQPMVASSSGPRASPAIARRDAWPPSGGPPGSDLAFMREQLLDKHDIEFGVMQVLFPNVHAYRNQDFAEAMATATNRWQLEQWCDAEPRLKGSIVIATDYPAAAVREIERWADHPAFVQIMMVPRMVDPPGRKMYWPIYEAAAHYGLPVGFHGGGLGGHPHGSGGWPSYYVEEHPTSNNAAQALIASFVMEGVFERFRNLRVAFIEMGMGWMPAMSWRLDRLWKMMRSEVPDIRRAPSEQIREHVWISTQPMEEPERPEDLRRLFEWIGLERVLFSTDYPHWDFDDPRYAIPFELTAQERRMIFHDNAADLYKRS